MEVEQVEVEEEQVEVEDRGKKTTARGVREFWFLLLLLLRITAA